MRRLGWVWPCALLIAGCPNGCSDKGTEEADAGPVVTGPELLNEKEPNERPEQALTLGRDATVSASLGADPSKPDEDWYRLAPNSPRVADVSVSGIPGGDVLLEVYDAPGVRSAGINSAGDGKPERFPNLYVEGERWVRVVSARKGTGGAYTLEVRYHMPEDGVEREPNDRAVDASPMQLGQAVAGFIGHAADEDWYRLELPEPPAGAAPPPAPEPAPAPTPGAPTEAQPPPAEGQPAPEGTETPPPSPSEAAANPEAAPAPTGEGDPAAAGAQAQQPGGFQVPVPVPGQGGLQPAPEEPPAMALKIELTGIEGVRAELSVLSAAEAPLFVTPKGKEGEGYSLRNIGVRASDRVVYVVVKSGWVGSGKEAKRGFNSEKPYTLTVTQEEAGANAELEPNDELYKATTLPTYGYKEGFLSPKGDVDNFVLKTTEPVLAKVELSGVERMDLELSVIAPPEGEGQKETVLQRANDGTIKEPERLNNVACSGTCYFRVQGASRKVDGKWVRDYENADQPYRISVTTVPDDGSQEREPNNTQERAMELTPGKAVRGTVYPLKDVDYYRLDLSDRPVRTPMKVTLLGILKVDVGLYLHRVGEDGKLSLVQTADRARGDQPEVIRYSAEPGVYLLEVRDARNREANFQDAYQLTVEEGE
ncbi:ABC transporter substrate-binding protein [Archangium lansingense]|uniref:ABC transporter substrate-binding protein n=1 Tax=Archangium lansingense TaxID=2995310 RepID=A0ABT4AGE7_9BACT|nr:ABC transporter substrate-binding protein [Archangium lansinium]MCY1079942.1 ABC transporter substrate-binding protein [Archangium lansinium]